MTILENSSTSNDRPVLNPYEQCTLEQVEKSLKYLSRRYQVALTWRENIPDLPFQMCQGLNANKIQILMVSITKCPHL